MTSTYIIFYFTLISLLRTGCLKELSYLEFRKQNIEWYPSWIWVINSSNKGHNDSFCHWRSHWIVRAVPGTKQELIHPAIGGSPNSRDTESRHYVFKVTDAQKDPDAGQAAKESVFSILTIYWPCLKVHLFFSWHWTCVF